MARFNLLIPQDELNYLSLPIKQSRKNQNWVKTLQLPSKQPIQYLYRVCDSFSGLEPYGLNLDWCRTYSLAANC